MIKKLLSLLPDELYLKIMYYYHFRRGLDLKSPKTFNEKLQWLKLNDRKDIYTEMVDKVKAKSLVASIIGEEYIIPNLGVWKRAEDIDFSKLPNQFVLKCNHDSHGTVICRDKDKLNMDETREFLRKRLKTNGYQYGREWPYKNVEKCILAEPLIDDGSKSLIDYKVHNFNGIPKMILVCQDRFDEAGMVEDFYSEDWLHLDVKRPGSKDGKIIDKPDELDDLLRVSSILSKNIPFLRTDFYIVNHRLLFSELTFFPASGFQRFLPDSYDLYLGGLLDINADSFHLEVK